MNQIILSGRMTKNIELREFAEDKCVGKFTLAVNRNKKDDPADFIDCQVWNKGATTIAKYCGKGCRLLVEGVLNIEKWEKDGVTRSKPVVNVFNFDIIDFRKDDAPAEPVETGEPVVDSVEDDNIPF